MWNRKSKINNFKLFLACSTTKEIRINSNLWKNTKKQSGIKNDREPGAVIKDIGNRKIESAEETDIKMKRNSDWCKSISFFRCTTEIYQLSKYPTEVYPLSKFHNEIYPFCKCRNEVYPLSKTYQNLKYLKRYSWVCNIWQLVFKR